MSPSLCHSRQVGSDSPLSPYILYPILTLLCLDPRGWRYTWQRAKPTGKAPAIGAKENGNNPRGEEWGWGEGLYPIKGRARSVSENGKVPGSLHLHMLRMINEHVLSFDIQSPKHLRCADCVSGLDASEDEFRGRRTGPSSEI